MLYLCWRFFLLSQNFLACFWPFFALTRGRKGVYCENPFDEQGSLRGVLGPPPQKPFLPTIHHSYHLEMVWLSNALRELVRFWRVHGVAPVRER